MPSVRIDVNGGITIRMDSNPMCNVSNVRKHWHKTKNTL